MIKPKVYIRADGNSEIGLGHVIRSLALAEMLKDEFCCIFVTRFLTDYINTEACKVCSEIITLPESDEHFDAFLAILSGNEIVVLDNYFFDTEYQQSIKNKGCKLVCIDDMHDKHFVADVVINHAPGINNDKYVVEPYTQLCLGLDYALIRKPFRDEINKTNRSLINRIKSVFVCFGGADNMNLTEKTIDVLLHNGNVKKIFAVIGDANKQVEKLKNIFKDSRIVSILYDLSSEEMIRIIKKSDLAIVPSSSVLLEIFSIGTPVITGFFVKNQKEISTFIVKQGLAMGVNMMSGKYSELLNSTIVSIKFNDCRRMVSKQKNMIRNAELSFLKVFQDLSMKETNFYSFKNFVSLNEPEVHQILEWRNHIDVRKWAYSQDIIPIEKHISFIEGLKNNPYKRFWLVQRKGIAIGVMSMVDIKEKSGEWGIYIAPDFHKKHLGVEFCYYSLLYLFEVIEMDSLYVYTLVNNKDINSINDALGFDKTLINKTIDGKLCDFYFRNISKSLFVNITKHNPLIVRFLEIISRVQL